MTNKTRNKAVKQALKGHFTKVSVTGGTGTATGWCDISVKIEDPCVFKQSQSPCSRFCASGICKSNNKTIEGGWGNTARQELDSEATKKVEELIEGIEFSSFCADDGYDTKMEEVSISVNYI